jgi:N-methylhydantoinase A
MKTVHGCRIGIDVGGTFTDFVLADGAGRLVRYKEPSVPDDPSLSVERGLPRLIERAGIAPDDVELVVHGTTLALNAIIQRRGARMGLVVSSGNRGVLEIARAQLPSAFSFLAQKEPPLVPRDLVCEVSARLDARGGVVAEATDAEFSSIADTYRAAGVEAVTIMLLHSYANPAFEEALATRLAELLPGISISTSAAVWPERREFERCLMALMNAYIQPLTTGYLEQLSRRIRGLGVTAPIYITSNNGGTLSIDTARQRPIDTILSGPASGVVAAAAVAGETPFANLITIDMGGTSADMSVIQEREPAQTTRTQIGGLPLIVPVVAVSAIGAGGGSIVWVDRQGALKVGPHSAGAVPGPACYGKGGTEATLTDCYLTAGYIDPAHFLGGRLQLAAAAAPAALEKVADALGMTGEHRAARAAEAAIRITTAVMSSEIARDLAQKGEEARNYALVAFGGAGPTHANHIADDAGIASVLVPLTPSTFCALGAILANVKRDFVSSRFLRLADGAPALQTLKRDYDRLEQTAAEWIGSEGEILGRTRFEVSADMRYSGQAFDLPVPLPQALRQQPEAGALTELFHQAHEKVYSFRDLSSSVEITAERLRVVGEIPPVTLPRLSGESEAPRPAMARQLFLDGGYLTAAVYQRDDLRRGQVLRGPAIIEQEDTTTLVLPGWSAEVDEIGNLLIARARDAACAGHAADRTLASLRPLEQQQERSR